jgi:hypothetical protein
MPKAKAKSAGKQAGKLTRQHFGGVSLSVDAQYEPLSSGRYSLQLQLDVVQILGGPDNELERDLKKILAEKQPEPLVLWARFKENVGFDLGEVEAALRAVATTREVPADQSEWSSVRLAWGRESGPAELFEDYRASHAEDVPELDTARRRKEIDAEVGRTMKSFEERLRGVNPHRLVEFSARCAERVWRLGPLVKSTAPADASTLIDFVTSLTALAARLGGEVALDAGRLKQAEIAEEADLANRMISEAETGINLADRWSPALLELGRVAARLFEAIKFHYEGRQDRLTQRASSVAAHALQAVAHSPHDDWAAATRTAVEADLNALSGGEAPRPFKGIWSDGPRPPFPKKLSKEEEAYKTTSVAKIRYQQSQEPPPGLENLTVPTLAPELESLLEDRDVSRRAMATEESINRVQRTQIADLQGLLDVLANKSFGTHEAHKALTELITKLAARANANLTISGEFPDPNDEKTYRVLNLEPVTVRCDNPKTKSLMIRSTDNQRTHIVNTTEFPRFHAVPKS